MWFGGFSTRCSGAKEALQKSADSAEGFVIKKPMITVRKPKRSSVQLRESSWKSTINAALTILVSRQKLLLIQRHLKASEGFSGCEKQDCLFSWNKDRNFGLNFNHHVWKKPGTAHCLTNIVSEAWCRSISDFQQQRERMVRTEWKLVGKPDLNDSRASGDRQGITWICCQLITRLTKR